MSVRRLFGTPFAHVMGRGVNGCNIFGDESDKEFFMSLVDRFVPDHDVKYMAFALMTNHFHFVVKTDPRDFSKYMMRLLGTYVVAFNRRWDRYGPLFQGRFKSVPILTPGRLLETSCYVHQNAPTAHMVEHALQYRWSSIHYYVAEPSIPVPTWIDVQPVLEIVGNFHANPAEAYLRMMDDYKGDDRDSWVEALYKDARRLRPGRRDSISIEPK